MHGPNLRGAALGLAAMAVLATHDVVLKALGARYSPQQILFFAALIGMPVVVLALRRGGAPLRLRPRQPGWMFARSAAMVAGLLAVVHAFATLPLAQVYALLFTMPLLVTVMSVPILGERVGAHRWAAVGLGLVGVLIAVRPGTATLGLGHLAALFGAATSAFAGVAARRMGDDESAGLMVLWPMLGNLAASAVLLPAGYVAPSLGDLGLMGLVAGLSLVGNLLMILAWRAGEAALVAPMQYSQILWATAYGWLLFDERPDAWALAGIAVIAMAGLYIVWRETRRPDSVRPAARTGLRAVRLAAPPPP